MSKITVKKKTENFTILDNTLFKDENLSWKAKGLLAYLLHLPNDWQIYLEDLKNRSTDGKESTRTAINELIEKGYIQRTRVHENGKFKRYYYTVFEKPNFQKSENQNTEIQKSENQTLINTEFKKELNVKNTKSINIHFEEFWEIYKKKIEKAKCMEKWNKLSDKDRELIMIHIPIYENSLSDLKYLKKPMSYLNSKMWKDIEETENNFIPKKELKEIDIIRSLGIKI